MVLFSKSKSWEKNSSEFLFEEGETFHSIPSNFDIPFSGFMKISSLFQILQSSKVLFVVFGFFEGSRIDRIQ